MHGPTSLGRVRRRLAPRFRPSAEPLDRRLLPATSAWSQVGTLGGVAAIVDQVNGGSELLAQKADGSIWLESGGQWTPTGGAVVPGTVFADGSTILGVAGGGTVWQYQVGGGWSQVGTLDGVGRVVASVDLVPNGAPPPRSFSAVTRYYAERSDGSVWVLTPSDADPSWAATGGTLEPGTMISDQTGVSGVAGGGTVFHQTAEAGWAQVGTLGGVASLLSLGGELVAQRSDASVWTEEGGSWTRTGGAVVPGTLIEAGEDPSGNNFLAGVAGGGTVWRYTSDGLWSQVGSLSGATSLVDTTNSAGQETLYARRGDGSVWVYTFGLGRWVATGGALVAGTMQAASPGILGVAGGGTVFREDQAGGQADPFQGAVAVVAADGFLTASQRSTVPNVLYAQTADGMLWSYSTNLWTEEGQHLIPGTVIPQNYGTTVGVVGVTPGGNAWELGVGQLGTLGGVARVVETPGSSGQGEIFAQLADNSVWSYDATSGKWSPTGGLIVPGTLVADGAGLAGVAGGGTVWRYADGSGWTRHGALAGASQLVVSPGTTGQGELFAQLGDKSVSAYVATSGTWTATGGTVVPGTLAADADGVSGVAGGRTAWSYADGRGWAQIGTLAGVTGLLDSPTDAGTGFFYAQLGDGSISYFFDSPTDPRWIATGGSIAAGTMQAFDGDLLGLAGGGTVFRYDPNAGWGAFIGFR